tara:strand:- start:257 stop:1453 length:1197 start_codon:yes stop_codon:yes gene_type:complete
MNQGIMALASAGRGEDTRLAHLMQGEVVVPPHILKRNKNLKKALERHLAKTGTNLSDITVGSGTSSINPNTGLEEFGFFSKLWKKVKKVIDPVAEVARFIPGPWQAPANIYVKGKAAIRVAKGEGGIGDLATIFTGPKVFGADGSIEAIKGGLDFSNLGGQLRSGVSQALGFGPAEYVDKFGNTITPAEYNAITNEAEKSMYKGVGSKPNFFSGDPNYNPETGKGQSRLGMIEDFFKGQSGEGLGNFVDDVTGRMRGAGIDPSFAAMATAYGLATKKALEKQIGGMGDIRDSLREDLKPATPYGSGGFDLGFAEGGEVMDMRDGGESIGPGTGTSDDIPAMLSDGEFVMTAKANLGAGSIGLKKGKGGIMQLIPQGEPDRERGADNMMTLMRYFEARA